MMRWLGVAGTLGLALWVFGDGPLFWLTALAVITLVVAIN